MRRSALASIRETTGLDASRKGQTYRLPLGQEFHLRTRQRDERPGGWTRYWFGMREDLWRPEDFFVFVCDSDFTLVVPVVEWLPYMGQFSVSMRRTSAQARQAHIWRHGTTYELREGSLKLDVRPWVNNFGVLG